MKVKLSKLVQSKDALLALGQLQMSSVKAFRIARFLRVAENEFGAYEDTRKKLVERHGEKQADESVVVTQRNASAFVKEHSELLEQVIEIDVPTLVEADFEGLVVTPSNLAILDWVIDFGDRGKDDDDESSGDIDGGTDGSN